MKVLRPGRPPKPPEPPRPVQMECRDCEALLEWELTEMRAVPHSADRAIGFYVICPECDNAILWPSGRCVRQESLGV